MLERPLIVIALMVGLAAPAAAQTVIDMPPPPPSTDATAAAASDTPEPDLGAVALARYANSSGPRSSYGPSTQPYYGRGGGYYGPYGYYNPYGIYGGYGYSPYGYPYYGAPFGYSGYYGYFGYPYYGYRGGKGIGHGPSGFGKGRISAPRHNRLPRYLRGRAMNRGMGRGK